MNDEKLVYHWVLMYRNDDSYETTPIHAPGHGDNDSLLAIMQERIDQDESQMWRYREPILAIHIRGDLMPNNPPFGTLA